MILEFNNVTGTDKKFKLKDINFKLEKGYIMGVCGKNGAGKTTLFDYILNDKKRYTGKILLNGEDIHSNHTKIMDKIGVVNEENIFLYNYTLEENAKILLEFYDEGSMDKFYQALKLMGLSKNKAYVNLSRGENYKFQMAFAMAHNPELYIIDEATVGMDPVFRIDFFKILNEVISDEQSSIIMTTHIKEEIYRKMDYVLKLEEGKMVDFSDTIS